MAAHGLVLESPVGPVVSNSHEDSSAEHSPTSSRTSSESPTVSPELTFNFGTSPTGTNDGESTISMNRSLSVHRFSDVDEFDELDVKPDVASLDSASPTAEASTAASRRPRGRPRKHPKPEIAQVAKKPMGRSKTGCITCRRRKKKCDERKPTCMHCEKNNVQCEGYQPKDIWQSGRQKAQAKVQKRWRLEGPAPLPPIVSGIESDLDWYFFDHFHRVVSNVLSINPRVENPFRDQLLPMAQNHRGLMHSLLSLSGTHLLVGNSSVSDGRIEERSMWHFDRALNFLHSDESINKRINGDDTVRLAAPTVGQVVVLCLQTICSGDTDGVYATHLSALNSMLKASIDTNDSEFVRFLSEFLIYHDMAASMTSKSPTLLMNDDFQVPSFIADGAKSFLGVCNGLIYATSKTRKLRDRVRRRREEQQKPYVDFNTIMDGRTISEDLKNAQCSYEINSDEWKAWNLYKTTFWLYLHRTLNNSMPSPELEKGVSEAIEYLQAIEPDSSVQSVLLTPLFIVACATFNSEQRPAIIDAFSTLEKFSSLGNIKPAKQVVDKVWKFMDDGNDRSWDWEGIMEEMGMNFLVT